MNHIQVSIAPVTPTQQEILIALLSEEGYEGFEELENTVKAYIPETLFNERGLKELLAQYEVAYQTIVIPEQNWNEVWESNFEPVTVDDFVTVRADFHPPVTGVLHEIVITPKMSFGTGHHATTYMMMQQMREIDFTNAVVFDFGTGTGILAILAEKLGAKTVFAVDNDHWCIENAGENIQRNNCSSIALELKDKVEIPAEGYDIILANINRNIILANLEPLAHSLKKGGKLLLSGLLSEDEAAILDAAERFPLIHQTTKNRDKWICMMFHAIN